MSKLIEEQRKYEEELAAKSKKEEKRWIYLEK